jgi:hypothetical protein
MPQIPVLQPCNCEQAYPNSHASGYSIVMSVELSESILSPSVLLWLGSVLIAAVLMLGLMNRRRTKLTDSLREFVDKTNPTAGDSPSPDDDASD